MQVEYVINAQHRDGNPNKSQWIISEDDESVCFRWAANDLTVLHLESQKICWGLYVVEDQLEYLGTSARNESNCNECLFIAKFVGDHGVNWHGYPANHVANPHDIPAPEVLRKWKERNFLRRPAVRKISKGQKCRL